VRNSSTPHRTAGLTYRSVTDLRPVDTQENPYYYMFKVQCTSCRETHPNWVSISRFVSLTYVLYARDTRGTENEFDFSLLPQCLSGSGDFSAPCLYHNLLTDGACSPIIVDLVRLSLNVF
jgi:Eukaryotic protein of unknown function (DUF866)